MKEKLKQGLLPVKLKSNRVWRTYTGGKLIEEWQNAENPEDSHFPEDWVASVVSARNPGRENVDNEGLSRISTSGPEEILLKDLIGSDPEAFLGSGHVKKYGESTALLVKLLDSSERLTIQVHPDRKAASEIFSSAFGKTEAWYIVNGRNINGEAPYVLLGFKLGVTRAKWEELFYSQDIPGMLECLHKFDIAPGEVYLIEGGVPHAIGPGCFLIEVQEPTDYSLRVERKTPAGFEIPDGLCHQGAGFEKMFDCFHYDTVSREEALSRWRLTPEILKKEHMTETVLIGRKHTPYFGMKTFELDRSSVLDFSGSFAVMVVKEGTGKITVEDYSFDIERADQIFIPASSRSFNIILTGKEPLKLLACYPPV